MKNLSLIDKAFILKKTALFKELDLDLLLTIADKMNTLYFECNDVVFPFQQEATKMYIVAEGIIGIRNVKHELSNSLYVNEFFGDESLFNEKPRAYEAFCQTDAALLTLTRTNLLTIISECPSVAIALLEAYTSNMEFRMNPQSPRR
jgi:CRP-like cAMP-binding protein